MRIFTLSSLLCTLALACPGSSAQDKALTWVKVADKAGWQPRDSQGELVFKDRLWIFGGWIDSFHAPPRDVWSSADGKDWKLVTANAGWSPRAYHQAVVHDGKIWVFGGGNYVPEYHALNDVWCSADGVEWTQVTAKAGWSPRLWFSAVTYRDRMWVLGGWSNNPSKNWGDVWHSKDGTDWQRLDTKVGWKERHEHSAYVFQDKLWVAGGHATPLSSEVWSLEVPKGYFKEK